MAKKLAEERLSKPAYDVKLVKNIFIPMSDGVNLAADLYRPDAGGKFPAVVIYLPYRKDDQSEEYAVKWLGYYARRGYASLFVDIRGTGSSEGRYLQLFNSQEPKDGYEAIEWIADQPWCDGNVGMTSSSYGGATSYYVAQQNPPHLRAIAPGLFAQPGAGSHSPYSMINPGGAVTCLWNLARANRLDARSCSPTTYQDKEGRWLKVWQKQTENPPHALGWLENQTFNSFWKELVMVPEKIKVPVFHWDGWLDYFYAGWALQIFSKLKVPKRILVGPWAHMYPTEAKPGPRIDIMHEILRWFDQWLKGKDTGVLREPPITIYVERYTTPALELDHIPGGWRYEDEWPLKRAASSIYYLHPKGMMKIEPCHTRKRREADSYKYNPLVGATAGLFLVCLPSDQRPDELLSLVYTSDPLELDVEVTGVPYATLYVSSTTDVAVFVVKLCDVAPHGASSLVARGVLNATRRNSLERPEPMEPGKVYKLEIPLSALSYVFEKSHRIRLDVASSDFPLFWPTPTNAVNCVYHSENYPSSLVLPVVSSSQAQKPKPKLKPPPGDAKPVGYPVAKYEVKRDFLSSKVTYVMANDDTYSAGRMSVTSYVEVTASELKPEDVRLEGVATVFVKGPSTVSEVVAKTTIQSTLDAFHVHISHEGKVNGTQYFTKTWALSTPRILL